MKIVPCLAPAQTVVFSFEKSRPAKWRAMGAYSGNWRDGVSGGTERPAARPRAALPDSGLKTPAL